MAAAMALPGRDKGTGAATPRTHHPAEEHEEGNGHGQHAVRLQEGERLGTHSCDHNRVCVRLCEGPKYHQ